MSTAIAPQKNNGTSVAPAKFTSVKAMLADEKVKAQIVRALPKHMSPERMLRIAMSSIERTPLLKECEPTSVGLSIIKAAEMGLEVDGWEGHLVPFKQKGKLKCQFIADYKGLAKLAYQSELVIELHAEVICENDEFDYEKGTDTFLKWKPARGDRGEMLGAWAGAKVKSGGFPFIVMWKDEIMQHKAKSQAANSEFSPWNTPEGEPWMWKKTVVRSLCKFLPRSTQLLELLKYEDAADRGGDVIDGVIVSQPDDEPGEDQPSKSDKIAGRLGSTRQDKPAQEQLPTPSPESVEPDAEEPTRQREPGDDDEPTAPQQSSDDADILLDEWFAEIKKATTKRRIEELRQQLPAAPQSIRGVITGRLVAREAEIAAGRGERTNR